MPDYNFTVSITVENAEDAAQAEAMLEGALSNLTGGDILGFTIEGEGDEV